MNMPIMSAAAPCINELKRNEACPMDNANHAEDADAANVADVWRCPQGG